MRFVNRANQPVPLSLVDADSVGGKERADAITHYQTPGASTFKFKAYKSPDVVASLEKLFHKKCAYCESRYAAVHPMDVEHYRPKLAVEGASDHPGYWWLAAEWSNLLPACIECNRRRYHDQYQTDDDATQVRKLSGKKDLFPIFGERRALKPEDDLSKEIPLLIDPTSRDPDVHLTWTSLDTAQGKMSFAVPRLSGADKDIFGQASIDVYGLNRPGLVEERTVLLKRLEWNYSRLQESIRKGAMMDLVCLAKFLPTILQDFDYFREHGKENEPYSACARKFIDEKITQLMADLEALLKK